MEKRKAPDGAAVPGDLIGNIMGGYAPPFVLQVLAAAQAQRRAGAAHKRSVDRQTVYAGWQRCRRPHRNGRARLSETWAATPSRCGPARASARGQGAEW